MKNTTLLLVISIMLSCSKSETPEPTPTPEPSKHIKVTSSIVDIGVISVIVENRAKHETFTKAYLDPGAYAIDYDMHKGDTCSISWGWQSKNNNMTLTVSIGDSSSTLISQKGQGVKFSQYIYK